MSDARSELADGLLTFRNSQGLECRGTLMHLSRQAAVFEVYNPYSIVQLSEVVTGLRIRRGERVIYDGRAVVSNLVNTGVMLIVSATLVDPWSNLTQLPTGLAMRAEIERFVGDWRTSSAAIHDGFRASLSRCANFLEELSRWLAQGEADLGLQSSAPASGGGATETQRQLAGDVYTTISPQLGQLFGEFEAEAGKAPQEHRVAYTHFAQRQLHPLIMCSPFMHRTFTKPLGYAGDFEMVNMILRDPVEGASTYARVLNMAILGEDPAEAHRNRIDVLVDYLERLLRSRADAGRPLRVLNIACGPAAEIQRLLERNPETPNLHLELLDFNEDTLRWTSDGIARRLAGQRVKAEVSYIHKSIHTLLKEASRRDAPQQPVYDLVYCAGLFDYLSDKVCERLLALFAAWTRPGGQVVATNVEAGNPIRNFMEHLLDWHLIYRSQAEFSRLAPPGMPQRVFADTTGVNIFLEFTIPDARP